MLLILPEILLVATAFIVLFYDLFGPNDQKERTLVSVSWLGLLSTTAAMFLMPKYGTLFGGRFAIDQTTWWFQFIFVLSGLGTVGISAHWLAPSSNKQKFFLSSTGEFLTIILFVLTGMLFLVSSRDLLSTYVSLELATIPLFLLTAWGHFRLDSMEAGTKYFISGALASALLLFGLGILFGSTGSLNFAVIQANLSSTPAVYLALVLIFAGIGFKMTLAPFHMWAPDVYEGAPTPITAFLSVASKATGVVLLYLFLVRIFSTSQFDLNWLLALIATVTMTLGNLVAIVQSNIKRFMAFSGISQAGYILMGFLGTAEEASRIVPFYLLVYLVSNFTVFAIILYFNAATGKEKIEDYKGLSITKPLLAVIMMIALFSLAGIPPLSGFLGKFYLFSVAARQGYYWLVFVAAVNSTVSLYYYLRIIRQMYIEKPDDNSKETFLNFSSHWVYPVTVAATTIATILLGIIPL